MSKVQESQAIASCLDVEEKEGICSITLKGLPQQILGMEMGSLNNLWQLLARYDKRPPDVLLIQLKNGLLGPDHFHRMMADFGVCSTDGQEWRSMTW